MVSISERTMDVCPHCDPSVDLGRSLDPGESCTSCGRVASCTDVTQWTDVARVANLAEAGFICDELVGLGIKARVHHLEDFDAASHRQSSQYLIRVPENLAFEAAKHVRQYLSEEIDGQPTLLDRFRFIAGATDGEPMSWRPIILIVLAGVASFALGQRFSQDRADQRPPPNALPSTIGEIGRPFITEPAANQPRYRLSYDRQQQAWTLDTDRDNDGQFESAEHFRATR
jgi:hypothetical protein